MASKKSFISYSSEAFYEAGHVYMDGNSQLAVLQKLRELGARRVLFICSEKVKTYKSFERLVKDYEKFGYRCFVFAREVGILLDKDVVAALAMYREFNCDTIITVGGFAETDCGKLVSALHTNDLSDPLSIVGIDKIKKDMSLVCAIVTDNSPNISVPFAEFMNTSKDEWCCAYSSYLMPQVVVFDKEICLREEMSGCVDGALTSLCMAIESYLAPCSTFAPSYKADALLAIRNIMGYLDRMVNSPSDAYLRAKMACGGFYAGIACTKTGVGYSHLMIHALLERCGDVHGVIYLKMLTSLLRLNSSVTNELIAELSKELHICNVYLSDEEAAEMMLNSLDRIVDKYMIYGFTPVVSEMEARKIAEEVRHKASVFELKKINDGTIAAVFESMVDKK